MKRFTTVLAVALIAAVAASANASIVLNTVTPVIENFDGMINTGSNVFTSTIGAQFGIGGTGFDGAKVAGTGTATAPMTHRASDGTETTASGALYSYGTGTASDRALGAVGSGSNVGGFGVEIVNNTGVAITSLSISATGEFWRSSTSVVNTLTFGWGLSGGTATSANYLTNAGASTALASLNVVGPAPVLSNGGLDGNLPANQTAISGTIIATINPGASLYIRWTDANDSGNDAGLAVDSMTITPVPEPASIALLGLGALALVRRRR